MSGYCEGYPGHEPFSTGFPADFTPFGMNIQGKIKITAAALVVSAKSRAFVNTISRRDVNEK